MGTFEDSPNVVPIRPELREEKSKPPTKEELALVEKFQSPEAIEVFNTFDELKSLIRSIEALGLRYADDEGYIPHERQGEIKTKIIEIQDALEDFKNTHDADLVAYFGKPVEKELAEVIAHLESRF